MKLLMFIGIQGLEQPGVNQHGICNNQFLAKPIEPSSPYPLGIWLLNFSLLVCC